MPPLKKLLLPLVVSVLAAALLAPSFASAQKGCRPPGSPACQNAERIKQKMQERRDQLNGVTPPCRTAANRVVQANSEINRTKSAVGPWKKALKNAKTKKAKAKYGKGLKKARARYKKAKGVNVTSLRTSADQACAGAKVKPPY